MPQFIFLDTAAYEAESFNTESTHFKALAKHLESDRLRLVITDITKTEVHQRIDKRCREELDSLRKMRKKARVLRSASRVQQLGVFSNAHLDDAPTQLRGAVDKFLDDHETIVVQAMAQDAGPVFERYFAMNPPFGPGPKRKEFPDAFVVEALIDWTDEQADNTLLVVSEDVLFRKAIEESEQIEAVETLSVLLDRVASEDAALAAFLRTQIIGRLDSTKDRAKEEFESLGFHVKDEWGDVEMEITKIDLNGEPDLIDISESEVTAELSLDVQYEAHLSYDDSSTGTYDREEGGLVFMEHVTETVHGSTQLTVTVTAVFDGTDTDEFEMHDIELVEPSAGFGIPTSEMAEYPWK